MTNERKGVIFLVCAMVCCFGYFVLYPAIANADEATFDLAEEQTILSIEAAAQTVEAPVLTKPTEEVELFTTSDGGDCHTILPKGTTLKTLEKIRVVLSDAGCNVTSWWSTVDIPYFGEDVSSSN
jgi:hypothetical protein